MKVIYKIQFCVIASKQFFLKECKEEKKYSEHFLDNV